MMSFGEENFVIQRHTNDTRNVRPRDKMPEKKSFWLGQNANGHSRNFKDLGLQGLSEACNVESSLLRRFLWGSLWLLLIVCCIVQLGVSLSQYISSPTNVNIRYQRKKNVAPSCVTFCPADDKGRLPAVWQPLLREHFGNISYNTTHELLTNTGMNASMFWNMSRLVLNSLTYKIEGWPTAQIDDDHTRQITKTELNTIVGVCLTFNSLIKLPCTGPQAYISILADGENPNTTKNEYSVIIHSEAQTPLLRYTGPFTNGISVMFHTEAYAPISVTEERNVNSWYKPCIPEADYFQCEADCVERLIRSKSKLSKPCRLMYMKEDPLLSPCSSADEFKEMTLAAKKAMEQLIDDDLYCRCHRPCKNMVYKEDYIIIRENKKLLFATYFPFPKCEIQVIEEEYSYQITNFISDIGGALGLYLGVSILSIVGLVETFISKLWSLTIIKKSPGQ